MIADKYKIAILHHAFDPRLNYLECIFARKLHEMGHEVTVFTTTSRVFELVLNWAPIDSEYGFKVVRTPQYLRLKSTILPYDSTIPRQIQDYNPDIAFLLAAHHGVGYAWMKYLPNTCKVVTGYSDLPWYHNNLLVQKFFKSRWIRRVSDRADAVWVTTGMTEQVLRKSHPNFPAKKIRFHGHGIDFSVYNLSEQKCNSHTPNFQMITDFCKKCQYVINLITVVNEKKGLADFISYLTPFLLGNPNVGVVFGGFKNFGYSLQLRDQIMNSSIGERFLLLPILSSFEMKLVFQLSKCSLWTQVSIGVYQSIACGCPALLKNGEPLEHVIIEGVNGSFYDLNVPIDKQIEPFLSKNFDPEDVSATVKKFCCEKQLADGIAALF